MSACPLCGKDCNFQSSSAGDRVHCTQCGAPLLVTEDGLQVEDDSYQGLQSANLDRTAVLQVKKPELPDFTAEGYRVFEKIGEGAMGLAAFEAIVAHPAFSDVPFYLEVPGYEGKGPDVRNVDTMKEIRRKVGVAS